MSVSDARALVVNGKAMVPLGLLAGGLLTLLFVVLAGPSTAVACALVLLGGVALVVGSVVIFPTPAFLVILNAWPAVLLLLQGLGLCQSQCGGFIDYQRILGLSTPLVGFALHAALAAAGSMNRSLIPVTLWRTGMAVGQGASLFFVLVMIGHRHWCPACAACHACMVAQACLLWRLTPAEHLRLVWGLTLLVSALGINAIFHHRYERAELGPSDALLGWIQRAARTETVGVLVPAPATTAAPPAPTLRSSQAAPAPGQRPAFGPSALEEGVTVRRGDFFRYGDCNAPITVRAHMSLVCPGCRMEWPKLDLIRPLISARKVQMEFIFTWPIRPETNYGAELATYVAYTAGMHGEEELMAVGDRLFSADGFQVIVHAQEAIAGAAGDDARVLDQKKDALAQLFGFCAPVLPAERAIRTFRDRKQDIDEYITRSVSWLAQYGDLATPHFYFLHTGKTDTAPYLDTSTMDAAVWSAFADKGIATTAAPGVVTAPGHTSDAARTGAP